VVLLTDGDFVPLPQHDVVGREVAVDDMLLLVQVPQRQAYLKVGGTRQPFIINVLLFKEPYIELRSMSLRNR